MLVATFRPTTSWAGKQIQYEGQRFVLEGYLPPLSARDVLNYDAQGHLEWASSDVRAWVEEVAAVSDAAVPRASGSVGVGGFIWSLFGLLFPFCSIPGLILSLRARKRAKEQSLPSGLAVAGIIISAIGLPFLGLIIAFLVMIPLSGQQGCGGGSSATDQLGKEIVKYQAAVKADPKNVDAWRSLGESYLLRANQQTPDSAAQEADWSAAATSYDNAVKLLGQQKGTAARQKELDALDQLVSVYLFMKDYRMTTTTYGKIIALRPKDSESYFNMATTAISAGDTNTALLAFGKFLGLAPDSPDAAAVRAWIKANAP